jgi:hypothetical protein
LVLVAGGSSFLAFQRYRRFAAYRVTHAMLGFLTVQEAAKEKDKPASTGSNPTT